MPKEATQELLSMNITLVESNARRPASVIVGVSWSSENMVDSSWPAKFSKSKFWFR